MRNIALVFGMVLAALPAYSTQSHGPFDGLTPKGLEAGAAAGTYKLSGLDNINLYNRSLSLTIPLLTIGGRGEAGYTIAASVSTGWEITSQEVPCQNCGWNFFAHTRAAGTNYRPAKAVVRYTGLGSQASLYCGGPLYTSTLTRLSIRFVDGSEVEFRDLLTGGQPLSPNTALPAAQCSSGHSGAGDRFRTFVAVDGSGMTFVADDDVWDQPFVDNNIPELGVNGTLYFRDGRQYHHAFLPDDSGLPGSGENGIVDWIKDRNGNITNFSKITPAQASYTLPSGISGCTLGLRIYDPLYRITEVMMGCSAATESADVITYRGGGGTQQSVTVFKKNYTTILGPYSMPGSGTYVDLFGWGTTQPVTDLRISRIQFPDTNQYSFLYTQYGEPYEMTLPTGAKVRYFWENSKGTSLPAYSNGGTPPIVAVLRRLTERQEWVDSSTMTRKTVYSTSSSTGSNLNPISGTVTCGCTMAHAQDYDFVSTAGSVPSIVQDHYYYGDALSDTTLFPPPNTYSPWWESKEFRTETLDSAGSRLSRRIDTWETRLQSGWWWGYVDARITQSDDVLDNDKFVRKVTQYSSDNTNNPTRVTEYGLTDAGGTPVAARVTDTVYQTSSQYNPAFATPPYSSIGAHVRSLPLGVTVTGGAKTEYRYDETSVASYGGALIGNVGTASTPTQRGNLTSYVRYRDASNTITIAATYDEGGNVTRVTDGRGKNTDYTYFNSCSGLAGTYAFVFDIKNALNQHTYYPAWDCYLGSPTQITDVAGNPTYATYNDPMGRLTKVSRSTLGGTLGASAVDSWTQFTYDPSLLWVHTEQDQITTNDKKQYSEVVTDRFGRATAKSVRTAPSTLLTTTTQFDGFGRPWKVSNPGSTTEWTQYTFDALGRVTNTAYPGGANETVAYWGERTLYTDGAGKQRLQVTDGQGRLAKVVEAPTTGISATINCASATDATTNLCTDYTYDLQDNLATVTQGPQTRSFSYNWAGELVAARNPEVDQVLTCTGATGSNWTNCYTYDAASNLVTQAAPSITTTLAYDDINRILTKTYSDGTPQAVYTYDTVEAGCLSSVTASGLTSTSFTYGPACQVKTSTQSTYGLSISPFQYAYTLAGALAVEQYPSGRTIYTNYDYAGRPQSVCADGSCTAGNIYANNLQYTQYGLLTQMALGNGLSETRGYNNRLQLTSIQVGSLWSLSNAYGTTNNNGNVQSQVVNGASRSYSYDTLNRLQTAQQTSGTTWSETYAYDRYGNRAITSRSGLPGLTGETPTVLSAYSTSTNRAGAFTYDSRGNLTSVPGRTMTYDGENRQVTATRTGNPQATYYYDPEGRRVATSYNSVTTWFVYDAIGNLAAEYGGSNTDSGRHYLTADHLGSTRQLTDSSGTPVRPAYDYLPFGEETGGSGCATLPGGVKFTGQYRDQESCEDYFAARYMSSIQGRFTSPDAPFADQNVGDPQSWNLYGYVRNNPLKLVDPTGAGAKEVAGGVFQGGVNFVSNTLTGLANLAYGAVTDPKGTAQAYYADTKGTLTLAWDTYSTTEGRANLIGQFQANTQEENAAVVTEALLTGALAAGPKVPAVFKGAGDASTLTRLATEASEAVGPGKGPVYGTQVHAEFASRVEALGGAYSSEVSYLNGRVVAAGTKGSVRLDVVVGPAGQPRAIFDLKTGGAKLTPKRIAQIRSHLPKSYQHIPIEEIRPE